MDTVKKINDKSYIVASTLKADVTLKNTEACNDYSIHDRIDAKAGEQIGIWIRHIDKRIYYTAFRKGENGIYFVNTRMKGEGGKLVYNCGGHSASNELKTILG